MSADPRKYFTVKDCAKASKASTTEQAKRKGFLENITKLGDLEVLNDVGFGTVAQGLRVLSSVADSVRVGSSVVPGREGTDTYNTTLGKIANTALDAVDQGAQVVLDATGLGSVVDSVGSFHPEVANRAYGQAKSIFQKVKQGNFQLSDIPSVFSDLQNLEQLSRGIQSTTKQPPQRSVEMCGASPYAMDLIAFAPKFSFLFVMDVTFAPAYSDWSGIGKTMSFVIKRSSRPSVEYEYEEVNMYNFWTRIPKRVTYPPVTMSFYDDNKNAAHLFYTAYMRAMSPISNMKDPGQNGYELNSMNFDNPASASTFTSGSKTTTKGYASSLGVLNSNTTSIVSRIRLYQIFDYGSLMNIYNFYNPRILSFTPTELNMVGAGEAEFEFQFAYDSMFIEPGFSIQQGGENKNIEELTKGGKYPIRPVFGDTDTSKDNSQQQLAPTAQEQEGMAGTTMSTTTYASAGNGTFTNFTSGTTGAINNSIAGQSNAFLPGSNFQNSILV